MWANFLTCIFGYVPWEWNSTCLFSRHVQLQHLSHLGSWASHSTQAAFRDLLAKLLLLKSNSFSSALTLHNVASDLGIQLVIKTLYQLQLYSFPFLFYALPCTLPGLHRIGCYFTFFSSLGSAKFSLEIRIFLAFKPVTYMVQLVPELFISHFISMKVKFMVVDRLHHACQL